jgi:hypothetical protein
MLKSLPLLSAVIFGCACVSLGYSAPKPSETPTEKRDKAVKEFVAQVLTALGKHDLDAFVQLCDVPYLMQPSSRVASGVRTEREGFKEDIERGYRDKPTVDGSKHVVRSIRTLSDAKGRLTEGEAADAAAVLPDGGLVVHVELLVGAPKSSHSRLLIREKDGRLRLVGIQTAGEDE